MNDIWREEDTELIPDSTVPELDRRRYRRYSAEIKVWFRELNGPNPDEPLHSGQSMNVSSSGLFIKANCFYRLGTMLEIKVDILNAEGEVSQLDMVGRVAWISFEDQLPGMGVEFKGVDEETRRVLLAYTYRGELHSAGS